MVSLLSTGSSGRPGPFKSLFLVLLGFFGIAAQTLTNQTILSHDLRCSYVGAGWISGADYITTEADDSFVCSFQGVAVYVIGQICASPVTCAPADTGTFTFAVDGANIQEYATPATISPPSGSTDGYADVLYSITGLTNSTHVIRGINDVSGRTLWFQALLVTIEEAASSSSSSSSSSSTLAPTIVQPTTGTSTAPLLSTSSATSSASTGTDSSTVSGSSSMSAGIPVNNNNSGSSSGSGSSNHTGAIVGGVVGGVVGLALLALLVFCLNRRRRRQNSSLSRLPESDSTENWAASQYGKDDVAPRDQHEMVQSRHSAVAAPVPPPPSPPSPPANELEESSLPYMAETSEAPKTIRRKPAPTVSRYLEAVPSTTTSEGQAV